LEKQIVITDIDMPGHIHWHGIFDECFMGLLYARSMGRAYWFLGDVWSCIPMLYAGTDMDALKYSWVMCLCDS